MSVFIDISIIELYWDISRNINGNFYKKISIIKTHKYVRENTKK